MTDEQRAAFVRWMVSGGWANFTEAKVSAKVVMKGNLVTLTEIKNRRPRKVEQ